MPMKPGICETSSTMRVPVASYSSVGRSGRRVILNTTMTMLHPISVATHAPGLYTSGAELHHQWVGRRRAHAAARVGECDWGGLSHERGSRERARRKARRNTSVRRRADGG